uniref:Integrase catalytic domain-containing protein n=1 Tax=Astyanax mexicanus TaxID=7994 RepID=A0A3B1JFC5_ASTMX
MQAPVHNEIIKSVNISHQTQWAGLTPIDADRLLRPAVIVFLSMAALIMDLQDISRELVRNILRLAEEIESGATATDLVTDQIHDFIEVVGLLSALSNQNIDYRVTANFEEVLQRFSIQSQQTIAGPGRPAFHIPSGMLEHHVLCGITAPEIHLRLDLPFLPYMTLLNDFLGCRKTDLYSPLTNEELDHIVTDVHRSHPNTGYKLAHGLLKARGVRVPISRLRDSFRRIDAEGVCMRRLRLHTLRRRQYSVPGPNYLWHIDGHHKLIRFVVHGGVDGFSRLVVYLTVAGNNRASTVLQSFLTAVDEYGLPSRVRSDKGGENVDVAEFMIRSRGTNRNSHITGRSVHNQRIERLWRDVYEHALDLFYQIFVSLEDHSALHPDNELHLFALHWIFLPQIQRHLKSFRDAWNFHGLRTERGQSPQQIWRRYREQIPTEDSTEVTEDYGIDWNGPHTLLDNTVSVPEIQLLRELTDDELASLPVPGGPLACTIGMYLETVQILSRIIGD